MTSVPSRIREVSRASAPSVTHESVGPGSPDAVPHHEEVVGAEERVVARRLRGPGDAQLVVVARALWGSVKIRRSTRRPYAA